MDKLRLLVTPDCNRNCPGCGNEKCDIESLPVERDFSQYKEVILTGGEPLLHPEKVEHISLEVLSQNERAKVYLYTAHLHFMDPKEALRVMRVVDGITLTLHSQRDVYQFFRFAYFINPILELLDKIYGKKSYRLYVKTGLSLVATPPSRWGVKLIEEVEECSIPEGKVVKRW